MPIAPSLSEPTSPSRDERWRRGMNALRAFVDAQGHARVPAGFLTTDGLALGNWVAARRADLRDGRLTPARKSELDGLGFLWPGAPNDGREDAWRENLAAWKVAAAANPGGQIPRSALTPQGTSLATWVSNQRQMYRKGTLSADHTQALVVAGFTWSGPVGGKRTHRPSADDVRDTRWNNNAQALRLFKQNNGHTNVPFTSGETLALAGWVSNQRRLIRTGAMRVDRLAVLEAIGLDINPRLTVWESHFDRLSAYVREHEHAHVPRAYKTSDGALLGEWVSRQRWERRRGNLHADQVARLNDLGMLWEAPPRPRVIASGPRASGTRGTGRPVGVTWECRRDQLVAFMHEHGHMTVPADYLTDDGVSLARWVHHQRTQKRAGALAQRRVDALDAIGFRWEPQDDQWEQGFEGWKAFVAEHGHSDIPAHAESSTGLHLYPWAWEQRVRRQAGAMSPSRIAILDAAGFTWSSDPIPRTPLVGTGSRWASTTVEVH